MKVLFLSKYSQKGASSRYRFYNYIPYFQMNSIEYTFSPLFNDNYIDCLYSGAKIKLKFLQFYAILSRMFFLLTKMKKYDLIVIEKELFHNVPYVIEKILIGNRKYALDFDDYMAATYKTNALKKMFFFNKIDKLVNKAVFVTAGNLWYKTELGNENVMYLPTVIDLEAYPLIKTGKENLDEITIVWIGSPTTARYLSLIEGAILKLSRKYKLILKVIGAKINFEGINVQHVNWSSETEAYEIFISDIGIMPLSDSLWEKGKCGFKLIQYMACGLPVIGSPSPANAEIIAHNLNGFLARDEREWELYLERLILDIHLRKSMGVEARKTIEKNYSYQVWGCRYANLIKTSINL